VAARRREPMVVASLAESAPRGPRRLDHSSRLAKETGADAAPFFRIFNPTTQAEKFDPAGKYCRRTGSFALDRFRVIL